MANELMIKVTRVPSVICGGCSEIVLRIPQKVVRQDVTGDARPAQSYVCEQSDLPTGWVDVKTDIGGKLYRSPRCPLCVVSLTRFLEGSGGDK